MNNSMLDQCKRGLRDNFVRLKGDHALHEVGAGDDREFYAENFEANLVEGITSSLFKEDYKNGGQEMEPQKAAPGKMAAIRSSSALVVNTFARWRADPGSLRIKGHERFAAMKFEAKCPTGLQGTPPHLDALLTAGQVVLGIESKCLEYLTPKIAKFVAAYDNIKDDSRTASWLPYIEELRRHPDRYHYLDAAQLIKHWLGLFHTFQESKRSLLYLFWEPMNWSDIQEFRKHRMEVDDFRNWIRPIAPSFEMLTYAELWESWRNQTEPPWLKAHVERLAARYRVTI